MATGETGFDDVSYDLISVQYHALKADMTTASTSAMPRTHSKRTSLRSFAT
jgi:hypothetical protein